MNYRLLNIFMIIPLIAACANSGIIYQSYENEQTIHYSQMESVEDISNYAIYLNKGDKILVKMSLNSDLAEIADEETHLVLKQKIYFRLIMPEGVDFEDMSTMNEEDKNDILKNIMIYLSSDANKWAPYTDINAVKQVFGIKGGSFSVGMGASKEDGIKILLNVRTTRM